MKKLYGLINILVLAVTCVLFFSEYGNITGYFSNMRPGEIIIIFFTVIIVHVVKALRLYFAMFGADISLEEYVKTYCKAAPVSIIWPWKVGELFRIYCYGVLSQSCIKGVIFIFFDRFIDTLALVLIIVLVAVFSGGHIAVLEYFLMVFILLVLLVYFAYSGISRYWRRYLLRMKATPANMRILEILNVCDNIFKEIQNVCKGKGIILFLMSVCAWGIEIGGLILRNIDNHNISKTVENYLLAAIGTGSSYDMHRFVIISVLLLAIMYLSIKLKQLLSKITSEKGVDA